MKNQFEKIYQQYLSKDDSVILALSGGADSVCLGQLLFELGCKNVIVAHFNHNLRGNESDKDEKFCKEMAEKWGFEFISEKWKDSQDSEEKARKARYEFLEVLSIKYKVLKEASNEVGGEARGVPLNKGDEGGLKEGDGGIKIPIVLAHHSDDAVETVFFNFLRGTGVRGLARLKIFDEERNLFRPLMQCTKEDILNYLGKNKIVYREDSTNLDSKYSRNFIRNEVFPLIKKRFPKFQESIFRSSGILRDLDDYLVNEAEKWVKIQSREVGTKIQNFLDLPKALQSEVLRHLWLPKNLDYDQVQQLIEFIQTAKSGKQKQIRGKTLKVFGDNFFVE